MYGLLVCNAVQFGNSPTFWRKLLSPFSASKYKPNLAYSSSMYMEEAQKCITLHIFVSWKELTCTLTDVSMAYSVTRKMEPIYFFGFSRYVINIKKTIPFKFRFYSLFKHDHLSLNTTSFCSLKKIVCQNLSNSDVHTPLFYLKLALLQTF